MLAAGEITGELDKFLDRLSDMLEKRNKIIAGIKKALFYPSTLIVVALGITVFMLTNVVPVFEKMYANLGVELPGPTRVIVDASRYILDPINAMKIVGGIMVFVFIFKQMIKYLPFFSRLVDMLMLKMPMFGGIMVMGIVARISLLMANLVTAGVGIVDVLTICRTTTNNYMFTSAIDRIKEGLYGGQQISTLFEAEKVFPLEVGQFISVGERSGNIDEMLESLASYYEEEFDAVVGGLTTVIEPLMIVVVGGLIGAMVVALYLPIFSAGDLVS
jgi:type IV pilus assembly protein PilC